MHNRMLNSLGLFSLVYRLQLWSIRGTIHLENDDGFGNPRPIFSRKDPRFPKPKAGPRKELPSPVALRNLRAASTSSFPFLVRNFDSRIKELLSP
jgi:hypothetical protein